MVDGDKVLVQIAKNNPSWLILGVFLQWQLAAWCLCAGLAGLLLGWVNIPAIMGALALWFGAWGQLFLAVVEDEMKYQEWRSIRSNR